MSLIKICLCREITNLGRLLDFFHGIRFDYHMMTDPQSVLKTALTTDLGVDAIRQLYSYNNI